MLLLKPSLLSLRMATACDSDRESVGPMTAVSPAAGAACSFDHERAATCIQGFYDKGLCSNLDSKESDTMEHYMLNIGGSCTCLNEVDGCIATCPTETLPLTNHYYRHVEAVRQVLTDSKISVDQMQNSLQYLPCLSHSPAKHMVFSQSSPLAAATDYETFLTLLTKLSSWYNDGFLTHIVRLYTEEPKRGEIIEQYKMQLLGYADTPILELPSVATSSICREDFEEFDVFTETSSDEYTLRGVAQLHDTVANVLGLKRHALLLQGLRKDDSLVRDGSCFNFWVPRAINSISANIDSLTTSKTTLELLNIARIEMKSETINIQKANNDSGYNGSPHSSNMTDKISHASSCDEEDEVFITIPSPDTTVPSPDTTVPSPDTTIPSPNTTIPSLDTSCNANDSDIDDITTMAASDTGSSNDSCFSSEHAVIPPPPGFTASACNIIASSSSITSEPSNDGLTILNLVSPTYRPSARTRGISLDDEILEEYERQSSILTTLGKTTPIKETTPTNEVTPTVEATPITETDSGPIVTLVRRDSRLSGMQKELTVSSQAMPTSPPTSASQTPLSSSQSSPAHAPPINTCPAQAYHIVTTTESTNFVRRVLLRASPTRPAHLHMVIIASQTQTDTPITYGSLSVTLGEKLCALYANGANIMAINSRGDQGLVPYSSCRLSRAYYGKYSRAVCLAQSQLFSVSTMNIRRCSVGMSPSSGSPVQLDMIAVKAHQSQSREQMSIKIGDQIRLLYCDDSWIYGAKKQGGAGFVPRDHCRLVCKSAKIVRQSKWVWPSLPFQADFVFNLARQPPEYLMKNPALPNELSGKILMITRNFTPHASLYAVRRGTRVKALYSDGNNFVFVGTISGTSFWVPLSLCVTAPMVMTLPHFGLAKSTDDVFKEPVSAPGVLRPRTHTVFSHGATPTTATPNNKKKVTFALDMPTSCDRSYDTPTQSPDIPNQLYDTLESAGTSGSIAVGGRRVRSQESIPVFMLFNDDSPVPSNIFSGCFSFRFPCW